HLAAFGSTRRAGIAAEDDPQIQKLLAAQVPVVTIFGKSWEDHVTYALRTTLEENLAMIADSVSCLKRHVESVIYDAEHFFDGYKHSPEYALNCLRAARNAGADRLVLCDTNGGTLPHELAEIVRAVRTALPDAQIGIHTHNDAQCGVANALAAIREGAMHVQG